MVTHGESKVGKVSVEYRTWLSIKNRCNNPKYPWFYDYGGRGIKVCEEWSRSFEKFLEDMGRRPKGKYSIDRINNGKGYCKDNCKWSTTAEQSRNRRNTVSYQGEDSASASIRLGGCRYLVRSRIRSGWSVEDAFLTKKA